MNKPTTADMEKARKLAELFTDLEAWGWDDDGTDEALSIVAQALADARAEGLEEGRKAALADASKAPGASGWGHQ